jgi:tripartite-type tricarboxylate transporter receptor subunit TctC
MTRTFSPELEFKAMTKTILVKYGAHLPKLPSYISNMWDKAIQEMLGDPGFISQLKNTGAISFYHNAQATAEFARKETEQAIKLFK